MSRKTRPLQLRDANGAILPFNPADLKMLIEYVGNNSRYYGKARPGASESATAWRIEHEIVNASGNTISLDYAGGVLEYDSIWDTGASMAIGAATAANPVVLTVTSTATLTTNDIIYIDSAAGMTALNSTYFLITVTGATTLTLQDVDADTNVDGTGYAAYTGSGILYRPEFCNYTFA